MPPTPAKNSQISPEGGGKAVPTQPMDNWEYLSMFHPSCQRNHHPAGPLARLLVPPPPHLLSQISNTERNRDLETPNVTAAALGGTGQGIVPPKG